MLRNHVRGYAPFDERFAFLFNSYYETEGERIARTRRGMISRPSLDEVRDYRAHVDAALEQALPSLPPAALELIALGIEHEQQHQELFLTDILATLAENPTEPAYGKLDPPAGFAVEPLTFHPGREGIVEIGELMLQRTHYARETLSAIDGEALGYVSYFAELIDEWAQEADPNETLFRLGASMTDAIAAGVPIEPLARYFEFWLLRLQGVYEVDRGLSREAQAFLTTARSSSPFALAGVAVSRGALRELEAAHRALIRLHLEKDLKSVRVLREMHR